MTGKRVGYTSVPYSSVCAFSAETAGGSLDSDSRLALHARGIGRVSFDYAKSVDVLAVHRFLSRAVILRGEMAGGGEQRTAVAVAVAGAAAGSSGGGSGGGSTAGIDGFLDVLGSNYSQIDNGAVESRLKSDPEILLRDERVEMAFKCGRDSFVLTSHRVLRIDVGGLSGKKGEGSNTMTGAEFAPNERFAIGRPSPIRPSLTRVVESLALCNCIR
jgi:hypothetical protein